MVYSGFGDIGDAEGRLSSSKVVEEPAEVNGNADCLRTRRYRNLVDSLLPRVASPKSPDGNTWRIKQFANSIWPLLP